MSTNAVQPISSSRVAIVGASGALGFGLMVRLAAAGVPIMIGSREVSRANDTAERAREIVPDGDFQGDENAAAARRVTTVILCVPFSAQAHTLAALRETMTEGSLLIDATVPPTAADAWRLAGVGGTAGPRAGGQGGEAGLGFAYRRRSLTRGSHETARRGRAHLRRRASRQARGRGADRPCRGPSLRRLWAPGELADDGGPDGPSDCGQLALQDARGRPSNEPA